MDKIFVLHHPPLKNRKSYLLNGFKTFDIDVEWVESFGIEEIKDDYKKYVSKKEDFFQGTIIHPYGQYKNFIKKITLSELSLYLKHKYCFEQQLKHGYETILILEDDILLTTNFKEYLNNHIKEFISKKGDMLIMGRSHRFEVKKINGKHIHIHPHNKTRCTHAIAYNKKCLDKILQNIDIINLPIDFKLNEIIQKENLSVYWSKPGLLQNKNYKSAIIKK